MHATFAFWGIAALLAAFIPIAHLYQRVLLPGTRYLIAMLGVCVAYPWVIALQPLTLFDAAAVYGLLGWIGPLYFLAAMGYLGFERRWVRNGLLLFAFALCTLAIGNTWHGLFAEFREGSGAAYVALENPGFGLLLMSALNFCLVVPAVVMMIMNHSRKEANSFHALSVSALPLAVGLAHALIYLDLPMLSLDLRSYAFPLTTTLGMALLSLALLRFRSGEGIRPVMRGQLLNLIPDAMVVVSSSGRVIDYNENFSKLLQRNSRETLGESLSSFIPQSAWQHGGRNGEQDRQQSQRQSRRSNEEIAHNVTLTLPDGKRHFDIRVRPLREGGGEQMILLRDVTRQNQDDVELRASQAQLRLANAELERLSTTDHLTGLRNRRYFLDQVEQQLVRSKRAKERFGVIAIDLDHFKKVNDSYGHGIGDEVLVHVTGLMQGQCRDVDTLARMGGEEFMVLPLDVDLQGLVTAAERFRNAIEASPLQASNGQRIAVTASIGAMLYKEGMSAADLLHQTDCMLYEAKGNGRNQVALA